MSCVPRFSGVRLRIRFEACGPRASLRQGWASLRVEWAPAVEDPGASAGALSSPGIVDLVQYIILVYELGSYDYMTKAVQGIFRHVSSRKCEGSKNTKQVGYSLFEFEDD